MLEEKSTIEFVRRQIGNIRHTMFEQIRFHSDNAGYDEPMEILPEESFKQTCLEIKNELETSEISLASLGQIMGIVSTFEGLWYSLINTPQPILETSRLYYLAFSIPKATLKKINQEIDSDFPIARKCSGQLMDSSWVHRFSRLTK